MLFLTHVVDFNVLAEKHALLKVSCEPTRICDSILMFVLYLSLKFALVHSIYVLLLDDLFEEAWRVAFVIDN